MKKTLILPLAFLMLTASSCTVVEGIFKAGVWVGVFVSALVVGLIIYLLVKIFKK